MDTGQGKIHIGLSSFSLTHFFFPKNYSVNTYYVLGSLLYAGDIVISETRPSWSSLVGKTGKDCSLSYEGN